MDICVRASLHVICLGHQSEIACMLFTCGHYSEPARTISVVDICLRACTSSVVHILVITSLHINWCGNLSQSQLAHHPLWTSLYDSTLCLDWHCDFSVICYNLKLFLLLNKNIVSLKYILLDNLYVELYCLVIAKYQVILRQEKAHLSSCIYIKILEC